MSLLLDALKKSGQTQPDAASKDALLDAGQELTLQEIPQQTRQSSRPVEDNLARVAGQNLFAAKVDTSSSGRRPSMFAVFVASTLLLGAGGAYYIWSQISPATPRFAVEPINRTATAPVTPPASSDSMKSDAGMVQDRAVASPAADIPRPAEPRRRPAARKTEEVVIKHGQTQPVNSAATAYQAYLDGDYAKAWQLYRMVLQQDANNRDALLGLAAIAQQQGQDEAAAQYYGRVLTLDPRDPEAHAAMSALIPGDAANRESRLKLLLSHRPDAAALHFALGNLYAEQSRWAEAQQAYFNSVTRNPDSAYYAYNLAVSLDHLGLHKQAAQYYQRALQIDHAGGAGFDREQTQRRADELMAR